MWLAIASPLAARPISNSVGRDHRYHPSAVSRVSVTAAHCAGAAIIAAQAECKRAPSR